MNAVFADTSFYIALLVASDQHHQKAVDLSAAYGGQVITTAWVLMELGNYFSPAPTRPLFQRLVTYLKKSPDAQIIAPTDLGFDDGLSLYFDRIDKNWSLVDCLSFSAMKSRHLTDAWTADHHFVQAGFNALLLL